MSVSKIVWSNGNKGVLTLARVAIALAIYKPNLRYLRLQLESIRKQTFRDWFVVLRDDSSTDVRDVTELAGRCLSEGSFQVIGGGERKGAVGNFAAALGAIPAGCELVAFCDQDDIWVETKLERLVQEFEDPGVMAAHSDLELIDGEGRSLSPSCWRVENRDLHEPTIEKLILRNSVTGCSMMFRASLLPLVNPIPAQPMTSPFFFHDVWVAVAALSKGRLRLCREPLVRYRQHGGNVVGSERQQSPGLKSIREKSLRAFETRRRLESEWQKRSGQHVGFFTSGFDFGLRILFRAILWSVISSRGYLRIGLQLALGKLFWDLGGAKGK